VVVVVVVVASLNQKAISDSSLEWSLHTVCPDGVERISKLEK